jgi:predicted AlkP superfamily phosphohydrolase/phosphomutase
VRVAVLEILAGALAVFLFTEPVEAKRVIVLGIDGLDYEVTQALIAEGRLPGLERLAMSGTFGVLGTSIPPQSPVAWSNFITGMDAGGHGIFDFIHRDPATLIPYLSTSRVEDPRRFKIGKLEIPISSAKHVLLRHGRAFWEVLEEHGVPTMIIRMPANFPPSGTATIELSGMGTPDILGTYGTFRFFTTDYAPFAGRTIGGGRVYKVRVRDDRVTASLEGPEKTKLDFTAYVDPVEPLVKLEVGNEERILQVGEWSDWVSFQIELGPNNRIDATCRFYLKEVRPEFKLFATSVNFDPMRTSGFGNSNIEISTPASFAKDLAQATGRFFTDGMPEDTKALSEGVFTVDEFLQQAAFPAREAIDEYSWVLGEFYRRFDEGLLFYYFGNHDQVAHMIWRAMDPGHPAYEPDTDAKYLDTIPKLIEELDQVVTQTLDKLGDDGVLVLMSDHGFASWRRSMNLNTWLMENGYLSLKDPHIAKDPGILLNVDWRNTRAYGLGLNGLYVNLQGRERDGIVSSTERRALLEEIQAKLLETVDPETGLRAVTKAYICEDTFHDRGHLDVGPDMIVGYAKQMRCSNESALGEIPEGVFNNNDEEWNGDHCMDHETVPGVLLTSRPLKKPVPRLENLAAAILAEFGIEGFPGDAEAQAAPTQGGGASR